VSQAPWRPDYFMVREIMTKSISRTRKKRGRGRPPTWASSIHLRVVPRELAALDRWIGGQPTPRPTRPEAIRRLLEQVLASSMSERPPRESTAKQAAELAARAAEEATDKSQSAEEQKIRKRKLILGPREFRDIRRDQPKRKG
jgi:hypothetical protein